MNTMKSVLKEAASLSREIYRRRPTTVIETRQILQSLVQSSDRNDALLTTSLLKIDKEIVYLKYEGIEKYTRNKFRNTSLESRLNRLTPSFFSSGTDKSGSQKKLSAESKPNNQVGRVAFMITKQQRQQLYALNYTDAIIKKLKPIEALLLVENEIEADETREDAHWRNKLNALMEENEQRLQGKDEAREKSFMEKSIILDTKANSRIRNEKLESNTRSIPPTISSSSQEVSSTSLMQIESEEVESEGRNDVSQEQETETENCWYEVVESNCFGNTDSRTVIAIYRSKEEAEECLEIKLDLMKRRALKKEAYGDDRTSSIEATKYSINQTSEVFK
eukprot:785203_1